MKKNLQKVTVLIIVISLLLLVGCDGSNMTNLGNALSKSMDVKSFTMDTTINVSGSQIGNSEIKLNLKGDGTNPLQPVIFVNVNANILQLPLSTQLYMEAYSDASKDNYIIKLPANIGLPGNVENKYLQFTGKDAQILNGGKASINIADGDKQKAALDLENKVSELVQKYYAADTTMYNNVAVLPNVSITNPEGTMQATKYTLSINNDTLKKAIKYYMGTASKDDNFYAIINDVMTISGQAALENDFKTQFTSIAQEVTKYMDDPNFELLGTKGAEVSFYVNDSGNVVKFEGSVDLIADSTQKQEYNVSISSDIYNLDKTIIEKPVITSGNSIKLTDLMQQLGVTANMPEPAPNKKIYIKENSITHNGAEYINVKDIMANNSVRVKAGKNSKYTVSYNNKMINITAYKITNVKYVNHKRQVTTNIYLSSKSLKGLDLKLINSNIITREKPLVKNHQKYISLNDVKRNTSISIKVDKNSKYVIGFDEKSVKLTPVKVTKTVYNKNKKHTVSYIYLSEKSLKDIGLNTKNN